jgi:uncharacterized damage-inducible protein DinB
MSKSLLEDAFAHHVWATLKLTDVCLGLTLEQLQTGVPGTYGTILDTFQHLVAADAGYLSVIRGEGGVEIGDGLELPALRAQMERHAAAWPELLAQNLDPEAIFVRHREDGSESRAPLGIRLAQVLHHGTDHRSQICIALTALGIQPPEIDVWDYAWQAGLLSETDPAAPTE